MLLEKSQQNDSCKKTLSSWVFVALDEDDLSSGGNTGGDDPIVGA